MTNRVAQLEKVIEKLQPRVHDEDSPTGQKKRKATSKSPSAVEPRVTESGQTAEDEEGKNGDQSEARLLVKGGKSQYIRSNFWATINDMNDEVRLFLVF
jgi:hypothetical protein